MSQASRVGGLAGGPNRGGIPDLATRPSSQLPLLLAAALLLAILVVPIIERRRSRQLRTEISQLYTPARDYIDDVELSLVRSMSALRGFTITGDERFLQDYAESRALEIRARDRFQPLIGRLRATESSALVAMQAAANRWHERIGEHIARWRAAPPRAGEAIPLEPALYQGALAAVARAEVTINAAREQNQEQIEALDVRNVIATIVLSLLALVAVLIMGRAGRQLRELARSLGRRARDEVAFRGIARELAAATEPRAVLQIATDAAQSQTDSLGAFIERVYTREEPIEVVAVAGSGVPPLHTRVPYPGSLTRQMIETGEPESYATVQELTGPMAANLVRSCGNCGVLLVPLGPLRQPMGTLVLLRERGRRPFHPDEIGVIRIVADFTSLALRRALLLQETEQRRAEVEASEQRYRSLFMSSPDAVLETDPQRRLLRANPAAARIFGYTIEELLRMDWLQSIVPEDRDRVARTFFAALGGEPQDFSMTFIRKDGRPVEIQGTKVPIVVRGQRTGVFTIGEDVTERRRYERALRETTERLEAVIEASPLAIIVLDAEGLVRGWNPAARQIFGWTAEEVLGHPLPFVRKESQTEFRRLRARVMRGEALHGVEIRRLRKNGVLLTLRLSAAPLRDAEGRVTGLVGVLEDITERKRAEVALRQTTETLETMIEASPLAIIVHDFDDVVQLWNPAAERIFGWRAEEVLGRKLPIVPEEEWGVHREAVRRGFEGESFTGAEVTGLRKDGTRVQLSFATSPLRDAEGRIGRVIVMLFDITRRKRAEAERRRLLERARAARAEAERGRAEVERLMESKARLIRGFGHDLKNPLGAVVGFAELLESGVKGPLTAAQKESVARIREAARSMLDLIDDLIELSRAEAGQLRIEWERTDMRELIGAIVEAHQAEAEFAGLTLRLELPDRVPAIDTDPARVRQVLGNLLSNATKYTPAGGEVTVHAECRANEGAPRPGRWLAVEVRDTGPGIPPEMHERIFEEFARLEPGALEGAGLGLAISRRIARLLGGEITLDSTVGVGSTFTLWLPLPSDPSARAT